MQGSHSNAAAKWKKVLDHGDLAHRKRDANTSNVGIAMINHPPFITIFRENFYGWYKPSKMGCSLSLYPHYLRRVGDMLGCFSSIWLAHDPSSILLDLERLWTFSTMMPAGSKQKTPRTLAFCRCQWTFAGRLICKCCAPSVPWMKIACLSLKNITSRQFSCMFRWCTMIMYVKMVHLSLNKNDYISIHQLN